MKNATAGLLLFCTIIIVASGSLLAQTFPVNITDKTPTAPLSNPVPNSFQPRYISGFGQNNHFTVFFEDRDNGNSISFTSTTSGPLGFTASSTATNIAPDYHFCVKDWPITIGANSYAYRAWASVGNNPDHHFYVSNDLVNWTLESTFQFVNTGDVASTGGFVYYGFQDVIRLNGAYFGFAETNLGRTVICRSVEGADDWEAFEIVGGTHISDGNLLTPVIGGVGWTPTGSFFDLGHDRGIGKIYVSPYDDHLYLAINIAAKSSLSPAAQEAAFIDPANWTWNDGSTGAALSPIYSATSEHDIRECWMVPNENPDAEWVIIYDADYGSAHGGKALGYLGITLPQPIPLSNLSLLFAILLMIVFMVSFVFVRKSNRYTH